MPPILQFPFMHLLLWSPPLSGNSSSNHRFTNRKAQSTVVFCSVLMSYPCSRESSSKNGCVVRPYISRTQKYLVHALKRAPEHSLSFLSWHWSAETQCWGHILCTYVLRSMRRNNVDRIAKPKPLKLFNEKVILLACSGIS